MAKLYYEKDANLEIIKDKIIGVIGYGSQGKAQANNMRDSGLKVILGLRKDGESWNLAKKDGFKIFPIEEAVKIADVVHILIPDEVQGDVYKEKIEKNLSEGKVLSFSHGFSIHFKQIIPKKFVDVIMIAPKGVGAMVRETYLQGFGVPALIAVHQNYSGEAKEIALAIARALGCTKAGVLSTTFKEETETDLFGEQVDLCGGVAEMIKTSFDILVKKGYSAEVAYFETLHELKLIVDLIHKGGLEYMWSNVSNTAEYGGRTRGKRIINKNTRKEMLKILNEIRSGKFAEEWINEYKTGMKSFNRIREREKKLQIEKIGEKLRKMFL